MCEKCQAFLDQIPKQMINVIEAHRAELITTFIEMTKAAKPEAIAEAAEADNGDEAGTTVQAIALDFAAFALGFYCGPMNETAEDHIMSNQAFNNGQNAGRCFLHAQRRH